MVTQTTDSTIPAQRITVAVARDTSASTAQNAGSGSIGRGSTHAEGSLPDQRSRDDRQHDQRHESNEHPEQQMALVAHPWAGVGEAPNGDLGLLRLPSLVAIPLRPHVLECHNRKLQLV